MPPSAPAPPGRNPAPSPGPGGRLSEGFRSSAPALNLPKGVGAIGGVGETFSASPVAGFLGNSTSAEVDYRMLSPRRVTDANGTEQQVTFDPLGRVLTTAVCNGSHSDAPGEVGGEYCYNTASLPAAVHARMRTKHGGADWQESWACSNGGGNLVQTKAQSAPEAAPNLGGGSLVWGAADLRLIGTGRTDFDGILKFENVTQLLSGFGESGRENGETRLKGSLRADLKLSYRGWEIGHLDSGVTIQASKQLLAYGEAKNVSH